MKHHFTLDQMKLSKISNFTKKSTMSGAHLFSIIFDIDRQQGALLQFNNQRTNRFTAKLMHLLIK